MLVLSAMGLSNQACATLVGPAPSRKCAKITPCPRAGVDWGSLRAVAAPTIDCESVRALIRSFPRDSGGGPSGLRPQHIRDAMVLGFEEELLRQLTALANIMARGETSPSARARICGASLTALPKEGGSHRPIVGGEVLRRMVGKCLMSAVAEEARNILEPWQMGCGTAGGCEAVVHACRHWLDMHTVDSCRVMAQLDLENAFNSVSPQQVLESCRARIPSLTPWVDWIYGASSPLWLGPEPIGPSEGVQQGDPLGPLLFSLVLHRALSRVRLVAGRECLGPIDTCVFYLDDGILADTDEAVVWFASTFLAELAGSGLHANLGKCIASTSSGVHSCADASGFVGWTWNSSRKVKVLGAAIGDAVYCSGVVRSRRGKAEAVLRRLPALHDVEAGYALLRTCASFAKLVYSAHTTPPDLILPGLPAFDHGARATFTDFARLPIDDDAWGTAQWATGVGV